MSALAERIEQHLGMTLADFGVEVERGAVRLFAQVIGADDPVYSDEGAAQAAGYARSPIPPTYLFSLSLQNPDPLLLIRTLGVDIRSVLHAEQEFNYAAPVLVGDRLRMVARFADSYERKGGALTFLVRETEVRRDEQPVATLRNVLVVRQ